jgi:hypothetical protein
LKRRFLKEGLWTTSPGTLDGVGLKLSYPVEPPGRLNFSLEAAEAKLPDKADVQQVVVVSANFGRECADYPSADKAVAHLQQAASDWKTFSQALAVICDTEVRP